ncbi:unnamed protein product [Fusarium equiseti]|uniref:Zn(2)-C6 fungal-type domain-containing protein n=1 Tax=Fusarium equiseti TaxID=61235 RepID=A0A8J2IP43_FUSEQ|nr:unnamed protein product [Fusarium equiseti]
MESQKLLPGKGAAYPKQHRRNYPRSKDGCLNCRAKRKKCDKAKPYCNACVRSTQTCVWPGDDTKESQSDSNSSPTAPTSERTDRRTTKSEGKLPIVGESDQTLTDLNFAMVSLGLIMESMALEGSWVSHTSGGAALLSIRGQDKIMKSPEEFEVSAVSFQQMVLPQGSRRQETPSVSWSSVNALGLPDLPYFYEHTQHMYQAACLFAEWRTALLDHESDDDLKRLTNIVNRALALDKRYEEWAHSLPPSSAYTPKSLSIESQPGWLQPLLIGLWKPLNTHTYPSLMIQVIWRFYWMVRAILNQALLFTNGIFGQRQAKPNPISSHRANIESDILSFTDLLCESCLSTFVNVTKRVPDHLGAEAVPSLWGYLILHVLPTIGLCFEQVALPGVDLSGRREWAAKLRHFLRVNFGIAKGATAIPPSHVGKIPIQTWGLPHKLPDSAK